MSVIPQTHAEEVIDCFDGETVRVWGAVGTMNDGWTPTFSATGRLDVLDRYDNEVICSVGSAEALLDTSLVLRVHRLEKENGIWCAELHFPNSRLTIAYPIPKPIREDEDD
jgi:hypothetical protein